MLAGSPAALPAVCQAPAEASRLPAAARSRVAENGEVLHVLLKRHPWGHEELAIPNDKVSGYEAGVQLSITKEEVGHLAH